MCVVVVDVLLLSGIADTAELLLLFAFYFPFDIIFAFCVCAAVYCLLKTAPMGLTTANKVKSVLKSYGIVAGHVAPVYRVVCAFILLFYMEIEIGNCVQKVHEFSCVYGTTQTQTEGVGG